MRVSTAQVYQQSLQNIQQQQVQLQKSEQQVVSGLRILTPADDPSGAALAVNINDNITALDQFERNATIAENQLALEETVIANATNILQKVRELTLQANNPTASNTDRQAIGLEIEQRLDELESLANTRDAAGEYIFAGYSVDSPPFSSSGGSYSYNGDQGQRFIQVGEGTQVAVRDSGRAVFQEILTGNGRFEVTAAPSNQGTAVIGQSGIAGNFVEDTYTVTFTQSIPSDPVSYEVVDSAIPLNVVSSGIYNENEDIEFAGAQFSLSGQPANGDVITLESSSYQDVFTSIQNIADTLQQPANNSAEQAAVHNALAEGLDNVDQALTHFSEVRSGIGARLNTIETQENINADFKLQLQTTLSQTVDVDITEAITNFNLQLVSLQAAQQVFAQTQQLSLFQFI